MPLLAPPAPLVARFRRDCEALAGKPPGRLGVAVSGGPDSLALLLLASAAYPGAVEAATVDHGLRAASADEALMVRDISAQLGCPHATLKVAVAPGGAGLQGEARYARYAALRDWCVERALPFLATAHHQDDQAETVLMRLQRGAGLSGLSAIRPVRAEGPGLTLIRPLLGWTRAELGAIVAEAGLVAAEDPSNRDTRFDRVAMRAFLAETPAFQPARLARSAAALREADDALDWMADRLAEAHIRAEDGAWRIDPAGLPRALRRRLLARAIAAIREANGLSPLDCDIEGLLATLEEGGSGTRAGVMARGGSVWRLRLAPPRRPTR
ncbi:tRNA lysidine(34) synthetase TilS [Allosphingosinicella humi]